MKNNQHYISTETKVASGILITLLLVIAVILIGAIVDSIILHFKSNDTPHEHEWVTVYYSTDVNATLYRCLNCETKKVEIKDIHDENFIPYPKYACNHIHYTYIGETFGTDFASDGKIYTYKCDDCGNRWEILITETSTKVIKEWKDK